MCSSAFGSMGTVKFVCVCVCVKDAEGLGFGEFMNVCACVPPACFFCVHTHSDRNLERMTAPAFLAFQPGLGPEASLPTRKI